MAMETYSLIINLGSASKKYALYNGRELIVSYHLEKRAADYIITTMKTGSLVAAPLLKDEYVQSLTFILHLLTKVEGVLKKHIKSVAIRVVAPGAYFAEHRNIGATFIAHLEKEASLDPLHILPTVHTIKEVEKHLPKVPLFAISDSAFHTTIDKKEYALPFAKEDIEHFDLTPYGYHGISLESLVQKIPTLFSTPPQKIVVCHLGGGSSVTALLAQKSIHTSMIYSPLGGVVMSSRSGSVDPGALLTLMQKKKMTVQNTLHYLYSESGMRGISGITGDTPRLLELEQQGDPNAKNALLHFTRSITEEIAKQIVSLKGIDAIIFTGTIGERSPVIRERIITHLSFLPVALDTTKNNVAIHEDALINTSQSKIHIATLTTNEMESMATILQTLSA